MGFWKKNIGDADRVVRLIVAIALLYALGAGLVGAPLSYIAGLLMLALFFTVATGTCALYTLAGTGTCPVAAKPAPAARKAGTKSATKKGRKKGRKK